MKNKIIAYKLDHIDSKIEQTKLTRDWMDITWEKHAYKCFPVSSANTIGWSISFNEDISFIWDGITDTTPDHVTILKGQKYCSIDRGNATVSFDTGIMFRTSEDVSMLAISPPNYFIDGVHAFTSLISTSFFDHPFPCAWRVTKANEEITIPAGTPVTTLIPISIKNLVNFEIDIVEGRDHFNDEYNARNKSYAAAAREINKFGKFTNWYRNAVNEKGEKIGKHEVQTIRLKTNDLRNKK